MNISTEQLKLLAEFLGLPEEDAEIFVGKSGDTGPIIQTKAYRVRKDAYVAFKDFGNWLHSNDGQAALIAKLVDEFIKIIIYRNYCDKDANAVCCLIIPERQWRAESEDPREALIAAVLQMLEGKK